MRMNFDKLKKRNSFELQRLKAEQKPIVGTFCTYTPKELIYAAGAVPVTLCANDESSINAASSDLPRGICPLIKSSYGYAVSKKCPYMNASDLIVGETTCDGKKKMYELLARHKEVYVLELPNMTNKRSLELWCDELVAFREFLQKRFNTQITDEKLLEAVEIYNQERELICELMALNRQIPSVIKGSELHNILFVSEFIYNKKEKIELLRAYIDALKQDLTPQISDKKRIMITGCPSGGVYEKVIGQIEDLGADVVVFENCVGMKNHQNLIKTEGNLIQNIAGRYLQIPCSVMYQNHKRLNVVKNLISEYSVNGVIDIILSGCHTYAIETTQIKEASRQTGANYMSLETDYSNQDRGQIRTRLEAFIELL